MATGTETKIDSQFRDGNLNVATLLNIGGVLCSVPQSLADAQYTVSHKKTEPTYFCLQLREKIKNQRTFTIRINDERYM